LLLLWGELGGAAAQLSHKLTHFEYSLSLCGFTANLTPQIVQLLWWFMGLLFH
jgi:hypothetical protein